MAAMAHDYPQQIEAACAGIADFALREVLPRHEANASLLEDPRKLYLEDGRLCEPVLDLMAQVRTASASEGFYSMCVPASLGGGGGGLGHLAYYAAWQKLFHQCGP